METIESWSARPDVRGARLADPDMGAENRRIAPFGPCPGVEFVTLEGIVQPFRSISTISGPSARWWEGGGA